MILRDYITTALVKEMTRRVVKVLRKPDEADDIVQDYFRFLCGHYEQENPTCVRRGGEKKVWLDQPVQDLNHARSILYKGLLRRVQNHRKRTARQDASERTPIYDLNGSEYGQYDMANESLEDMEHEDGLEAPMHPIKKGAYRGDGIPPDAGLTARDVQWALSQISPMERYIAEQLWMADGESPPRQLPVEIAAELGCSKRAVWYGLKRAQKKLRQLLADYHPDRQLARTNPAWRVRAIPQTHSGLTHVSQP